LFTNRASFHSPVLFIYLRFQTKISSKLPTVAAAMNHQEVPELSVGAGSTNGVEVSTAVACSKAASVAAAVGELVGVAVWVGCRVGVAVEGTAVAVWLGVAGAVAVAVIVGVAVTVRVTVIGAASVAAGVAVDRTCAAGSAPPAISASTKKRGGPPI
jgi:hypothetical protein